MLYDFICNAESNKNSRKEKQRLESLLNTVYAFIVLPTWSPPSLFPIKINREVYKLFS